jgi:hypothetical protein
MPGMTSRADHRGVSRPRRTVALVVVTLVLLVGPVAVALAMSGDAGVDVPDISVTSTTVAGSGGSGGSGSGGVIIEQGGTGDEPTSAADALTPTGGGDDGPRRIKYLVGDGWVPIENGGTVPLADGMAVTVTLDPYPPIDFACRADLYLTKDGEPVTDAEIAVVYDMFIMGHGPFTATFENLGDGHYVADFDFFMFGPWELLPTVTVSGGSVADFTLSLYIWPV